jgi:hypothetical protein
MANNKLQDLQHGTIYLINGSIEDNETRQYLKFRLKTNDKISAFNNQELTADEINGTYIAARMFNIGNIGRYAVLKCKIKVGEVDECVNEFTKKLFDVKNMRHGDFEVKPFPHDIFDQVTTIHHDLERTPQWSSSFMLIDKKPKPEYDERICCEMAATTEEELQQDDDDKIEEKEIKAKEREKEKLIKIITDAITAYMVKFHSDPSQHINELIKGKIAINPSRLSNLIINKEMEIILQDYNEVPIKLAPKSLALYILFLKHPEGINLGDIHKKNYKEEYKEIYDIIKPQRNAELEAKSIERLLNQTDHSALCEQISRIKKTIKNSIIGADDIVKEYYIDGSRGDIYRIAVERKMVTIPRIFTQ